ncbi:ANTAR domain-containing protein [Streptomyces sp. NPDC006465]|uniref:ANTAR domain-containing protein n=1 Tax=Streptomyces sp. NPDC006465 TaxID=3157174 RepID=UPI0033BEF271
MSEPLPLSHNRNEPHLVESGTDGPVAPTEAWLCAKHAADETEPRQEQVSRLSQDLVSRMVIDQAVGVVMALGRLGAEQAWAVLIEVCQRTDLNRRRFAELLTAWAPTGELNLGIRIALEEAIRRQHTRSDGQS